MNHPTNSHNIGSDDPCPCCSGNVYGACCMPYHNGNLPENAMQLMRSRYSAYKMHLAEYIIQTTHPDNPQYDKDFAAWIGRIIKFSKTTSFNHLDVLDFEPEENTAWVRFKATLMQEDKDVSFTERSYFVKEEGKWLYRDGQVEDS